VVSVLGRVAEGPPGGSARWQVIGVGKGMPVRVKLMVRVDMALIERIWMR
tara:strand:- start:346 stop:495 length:150 start_codon:yes stop_codon:yes gene_type:complete